MERFGIELTCRPKPFWSLKLRHLAKLEEIENPPRAG
jgi:hypothetical protein